jgi:hypothetical protein
MSLKVLPYTVTFINRTIFHAIISVLQSALLKNFSEASVAVSKCPDLTKAPFNLAGKGNVTVHFISFTNNVHLFFFETTFITQKNCEKK